MNRRTVVRTSGGAVAGAVAGFAGCLTRNGDDEPDEPDRGDPEPDEPDYDGTLRVVTYRSMVSGTDPAGPWIKDAFEEAYPDAELEWVIPEAGVEHYVRRGEYDAEIDVDVLFGFTIGDLARIDARVGDGSLLRELNRDRIDGVDGIRGDLAFGDPHGRALVYDFGFVSLVYDETVVDAPETFDALLGAEYEDALLAQRPDSSLPGQAFLLWTIETADPDAAMTYWKDLAANGADVRDSWSDAYGAYADGERPVVVSYSTDPVFASAADAEMSRHQVAFLDEAGYALPEGMGIFDAAPEPDLAYAFLEFVLSREAQAELARRNVQFPAVEGVELGSTFEYAAREPSDPVAMNYATLRGNVTDWLAEWTDRFDESEADNQ